MSVLVDTSVWVDHFKRRNTHLTGLVQSDAVLIHPMIVAEIACGTPPTPRARTLADLGLLRSCEQATIDEVIAFVEREKLYGLGCGLIDMVLLASTRITPGARLWSLDRRLAGLAVRLKVAYSP